MEIIELKKEDEKVWDEYVLGHPSSTFYHQIRWKHVVENSYGHKPCYLLAKEDGKVKGVLPLFFMKSLLFGTKLISLPFAPYGGACADTKPIENELIKEAQRITKEFEADYLEIRHLNVNEIGLVTYEGYFTLILKLEKNPDVLWNLFRKSVRRYIRKGIQNNLRVTINSKSLNDFYDIYLEGMHNLGTPAHSIAFFRNILLEFPENTNIATIEYNGKIISAILILYFKNTMIYGWGASRKEYLELSPNYLLFWEILKIACEKSFNFFDFGRSQQNTGVFFFKEGWGAEPKRLYYQYHLNNIAKIPETSQSNTRRQKFAKVWSKLPCSLTKKIGPILRRNIP